MPVVLLLHVRDLNVGCFDLLVVRVAIQYLTRSRKSGKSTGFHRSAAQDLQQSTLASSRRTANSSQLASYNRNVVLGVSGGSLDGGNAPGNDMLISFKIDRWRGALNGRHLVQLQYSEETWRDEQIVST